MKKIQYFIIIAFLQLLMAATCVHAASFCFEEAGAMYSINPQILRAIAKVESNFNPRAVNYNTNGTYDFGVMQINSSWAATLGRDHWNTLGDACSNIKTGAMVLSGCMKRYGYNWEAVGCYNSSRPDKRDKYARMVFTQLKRIEKEDHQLNKTMEAVIRAKIHDLVRAGLDGEGSGKVVGKVTVEVPASREMAAEISQAGFSEQSEPQAIELRVSSSFDRPGKGL
jgi:hypothetical protein